MKEAPTDFYRFQQWESRRNEWPAVYHAKRPGLQVLQQQIDNFIADYEVNEQKARREKEAAAADEGWTVVTHQKGRKKTKDSETGVTVGAVAPSVAERSAKKMKEAPTDFYRFQQRESRINEWLAIYHAKRPGLQVLQQQIDNFIADYEVNEEKARREKEAAAADEGWTVVTHQKGRKKTKDSETGVTVGAVAPSVAERSAKKMKEAPTNFYRFQQRESRRNEVLQLQRRFEEDKKRIAKLKTARKFRPY